MKTQAEQEAAFREWGLTNDPKWRDLALVYLAAALNDGWESKDATAEHFTKDGFTMHILARDGGDGHGVFYRYQCSISIWGPDHLAIKPPDTYDWDAIQAGVRHCNYCDADDVETERVGFAGRCCAACVEKQRGRLERPGWTN